MPDVRLASALSSDSTRSPPDITAAFWSLTGTRSGGVDSKRTDALADAYAFAPAPLSYGVLGVLSTANFSSSAICMASSFCLRFAFSSCSVDALVRPAPGAGIPALIRLCKDGCLRRSCWFASGITFGAFSFPYADAYAAVSAPPVTPAALVAVSGAAVALVVFAAPPPKLNMDEVGLALLLFAFPAMDRRGGGWFPVGVRTNRSGSNVRRVDAASSRASPQGVKFGSAMI